MRASETLLNEAAWKEPPLRSAGRTVARRTVAVGREDGRGRPRLVVGATVRGAEGTGPGLRT